MNDSIIETSRADTAETSLTYLCRILHNLITPRPLGSVAEWLGRWTCDQ